ncbi:translocase of chloroplast 120, chloroplastic-like [Telopea speciosissima]|uniref:translocase of chloroplast 120, chloroplastic-like n=1 Tax=Telopea speciosissima TaxID=54955 RepID=UPI001CC78F14|nr:translocase of chloroplast 120, chloroplastic-like [Telopea speciosissima]
MENGVATDGKSHFGETLAIRDGISNPEVGDRDVHGLHESKDSEGQLFVEASEEIHSLESPVNLDADQAVKWEVHVDKTRDSGSLVVNGMPNGDHEMENFEEAIGLPLNERHDPVDEIGVAYGYANVEGNPEEVLPVESNGLDNFCSVGNAEAVVNLGNVGGNAEEVLPVESNGLDNFCSVGNAEAVVHLGNDLSQEGEQQLAIEKMITGLVLEEPVDEIIPADETGNVERYAEEVLPVESKRFDGGVSEAELRDVSDTLADRDAEPSRDGTEAEGRSDLVTDKSETGDLDDMSFEESPVLFEKADAVKIKQVESDVVGPSHGDEPDELIVHQDGESGELQEPSANLAGEGQDHQSVHLKNSSTEQDPSLTETGTREVEILKSVEESNTVKAGAAEPEAKGLHDSQPQFVDRNIKEGSSGHTVVEEPVSQETKKVENRGPEIQSARNVGSSTESSTNPPLPPRPAGLGSAPLLGAAHRALQQSRANGSIPVRQSQLVEDPMNGEAEENDETREKLQMIRVKFLRLAHRLGQTPHNVVVAQVLYRLGLAEQLRGRNTTRAGAFSFDTASAMAEQLEAAGQEALDFSCTIMVIGKTGVGKSATINSIFDEVKFDTDAFDMGTKKVQDVVGTVQGIKVRVIDTPGLLSSWSDQRQNEKILHSVKRFIKKTPPDIVLYLDRLDMQSRDFGDMPLLQTITEIFGPSIWFNAIVVLTHAASAPPDGPNGTASSYEMFVTQRSHVVQQAIRQAAGDMRLMNPVSLVENHSACRTNRAGQRVLPNGQVWKPHLLLLSFASKILAEANTLLNMQDSPPGRPFVTRSRAPPLPFLLSSLLQSRPQLKLPEEQFGDDEDALDEDLDEASDSDEETDYDELPPFKRLTKAQLAKLSRAQKKAYFDELEYREKLFMKKQLKEERKRRKFLKKMAASAKDLPNEYNENAEEESGGAASVPVPMPDLALPTSFDSDNPTHRYRFLDSSNQWLVRPVLETHGWDHDVGYEGINVERLFVVKDKIPLSFSGQVTKDKKEANIQMELAGSVKHGEGKATSLGFDMQTVGKDMAYTLRSETRFSNFKHNKTAAGFSVTQLGDALSAGVKVEDKLIVNKWFRLVMTGGAMTSRGDVAYGGSLEATLRDKDYPLGRMLSTLGLSIMDWHGDLAIGCNVQSQLPIGRAANIIARANLNNRGAGQVSIRLNSSEHLQIALIGLIPLLRKVVGYSQQLQFGQ